MVVGGIVVVIPIHFCVCSSTFVDIDENHGSHQGGEGREIWNGLRRRRSHALGLELKVTLGILDIHPSALSTEKEPTTKDTLTTRILTCKYHSSIKETIYLEKWLFLGLRQREYKVNILLCHKGESTKHWKTDWGLLKRTLQSTWKVTHSPNLGQFKNQKTNNVSNESFHFKRVHEVIMILKGKRSEEGITELENHRLVTTDLMINLGGHHQ